MLRVTVWLNTQGYSFLEYGTDAFYDLGRMQELATPLCELPFTFVAVPVGQRALQDTIQSLDKDDQAMWKVPPLPWLLGRESCLMLLVGIDSLAVLFACSGIQRFSVECK